MTKYIIMVGLPGSGKSTVAKTFGFPVFSSDQYRLKLLGNENDQSNNQKVFNALHKDIKEALQEGKSVVYDATNINRKARKQAIECAKNIDCEIIAYVKCPDIATCVARNNLRERKVPEEVIMGMMRKFELPQKFEGFTDIIIDNEYKEECRTYLEYLAKRMIDFDQENPHHKFTLAEHCRRVANQFDRDTIEHKAGIIHDTGKLFTKRKDERGVAHYYNHDNVGTYIYLNNIEITEENKDKWLEILFFVNYHMRAHNDLCSAKAERKYRNLFGDKLFDRLMKFAEADRIATGTEDGKRHER